MNDYSNWGEYSGTVEGSGRSEKVWLQNPDTGKIALFKVKKDVHTTDHLSERIAYQLAQAIGIDCAYYAIGTYHGKEGSLSYNFLPDDKALKEGIHYINKVYPNYDPDKIFDVSVGAMYSFEMIEESLREFDLMDEFLMIPVFDFFIGNTDRHQNNWGTLERDGQEHISPLYDNSSSLCAYVQDPDAYIEKDKHRFQALVDTKCRSAIRLKKTDRQRPTHRQALQYLQETYPVVIRQWEERILSCATESVIQDILNTYDPSLLADNRKEMMYRFLIEKRNIMKQVLEGKE